MLLPPIAFRHGCAEHMKTGPGRCSRIALCAPISHHLRMSNLVLRLSRLRRAVRCTVVEWAGGKEGGSLRFLPWSTLLIRPVRFLRSGFSF